ncbi:MAG: hypothetical protein QF893_15755 [Alphaproteobacteria bacterium]|jgi:hypothetical protein|nr:hypothetical protein [Alphaproteobacteria bacterium]
MEPWHGLPVFPEMVAWEEAQAALEAQELGDGLPLVPPTEPRLDRMLAGVTAPEQSCGQVAPLFGELTPAAVAHNAVMAGCRPAELPVVLTAVEACLAPEFNLLGIATTTGTPAVAVVVHGPVASALGLNAATNCLGPGNRANASIGRAVSLVLRNVGGAKAGTGDMATMGQPGKYGFCFAESDDASFPPLHVRRGLDAGESAVTVLGVSGTAEVLPAGNGDTPELVLHPLAAAMATAIATTGAGRRQERGEQFFLLPPELARLVASHGWDLARVQGCLFEAAGDHDSRPVSQSPGDIHAIVTGGAGIKMTYLPLWAGGSRSVTMAVRELRG